MTRFLAAVGAGLVFMALLGAVGIGHFDLYYGPEKRTCGEVKK